MNPQEWLQTTYYSYLGNQINTSMTYLHSTVNWANTLLSLGMALVVSSTTFPDPFGLIGLLFIFTIMNHFAIRTAKAYLNVIRFSTLQKHILKLSVEEDPEADWSGIKEKAMQYDYDWTSPLTMRDLLYKVVMELGFMYYYLIIVILLIYSYIYVEVSPELLGVTGIAAILSFLELWFGLKRSLYMRKVVLDPLAKEKR
ncbi:hypothetical protein HYR53_10650 [Candidatus Acetothermia bacterium]|nr:hypothetical protein [Candidatus Acetothermia bacterium]